MSGGKQNQAKSEQAPERFAPVCTVVGAGLAGCEAAWHIANAGFSVNLIEQKPGAKSPAHESDGFAELVCSNSLGAARPDSASGLLKEEMRRLGSLCTEAAALCAVDAGGALAVDRDAFSDIITKKIRSHKNIKIIQKSQEKFPEGYAIIATGPLTSDAFAAEISQLCGGLLSFYDAAAPIVTAGSIDPERSFLASRYDRGGADYINCPLDKPEYEAFCAELIGAETVRHREFEKKLLYERCMPVEFIASRGPDTLRFGPLKPVGLRDPKTGKRPWAVVQLRRENSGGTLYNLVGFQTSLCFAEQRRVFSMIPALRNADFVRYGVMHRNTFINSPELLSPALSLKSNPGIFFAGQITGVEGYMPSAATGIIAGMNFIRSIKEQKPFVPPEYTMTGALLKYITDETVTNFQPMGPNFGILPPLPEVIKDKKERYGALAARALEFFEKDCIL